LVRTSVLPEGAEPHSLYRDVAPACTRARSKCSSVSEAESSLWSDLHTRNRLNVLAPYRVLNSKAQPSRSPYPRYRRPLTLPIDPHSFGARRMMKGCGIIDGRSLVPGAAATGCFCRIRRRADGKTTIWWPGWIIGPQRLGCGARRGSVHRYPVRAAL
jgi:hypothetical protein